MNRLFRHAAGMALTLAVLGAFGALAGCAPAVRSVPAQIGTIDPARKPPDLQFSSDLPLRFETGYSRVIPAHSRWKSAGHLNGDVVYQPIGIVFSVEGQQVHEAWLVIRAGTLQGFYLPAEARYAPLDPPVPLPKGTQP